MSQEVRFKNIDETKICYLEEIKQNKLMNRKGKKVCTTPNCIKNFLILPSTITTGCIFISNFTSSLCIPTGIISFAIGLKMFAIAAEIKKCKSLIKKSKKSMMKSYS